MGLEKPRFVYERDEPSLFQMQDNYIPDNKLAFIYEGPLKKHVRIKLPLAKSRRYWVQLKPAKEKLCTHIRLEQSAYGGGLNEPQVSLPALRAGWLRADSRVGRRRTNSLAVRDWKI